MKISESGLALIRTHEGLRLKAYRCPAGKLTIGYGHTRGVRPGDTCTKAEAENMLRLDTSEHADIIRHLVKVPLTQGQFDALSSFIHNFGGGKFERSTLLRYLNESDYSAAANQFDRWVHGVVDGVSQILNGLVLRRADEKALFLA